jgi:hypothetical protein
MAASSAWRFGWDGSVVARYRSSTFFSSFTSTMTLRHTTRKKRPFRGGDPSFCGMVRICPHHVKAEWRASTCAAPRQHDDGCSVCNSVDGLGRPDSARPKPALRPISSRCRRPICSCCELCRSMPAAGNDRAHREVRSRVDLNEWPDQCLALWFGKSRPPQPCRPVGIR